MKLDTFDERFRYLKLDGHVGASTFGPDRVFNQMFYQSKEWRDFRNYIIARDCGMDLGCVPLGQYDRVVIHHLNPITMDDISTNSTSLLDPNNAITTTFATHNAIHFGDNKSIDARQYIERTPGDTCLWKKGGC